MTELRFMTPEEEREYSPYTGFAGEEPREIALRRGYPPESMGRTIRHELGHIQYPVKITFGPVEEPTDWEKFNVEDLFRELGASYFALKQVPRDPDTRYLIRKHKKWAREEGLTPTMIARIDRLARERVGYTGREVK